MGDKVVYHGATVVTSPPPYSAGPQPGPYGQPPGVYSHPPGAYIQGPVVHATVGTTVVPVVVAQQMGTQPALMTCKSCHSEIMTRVESQATMRTHLCALMLCLLGCWPCVCVPYCVDSCMNTNHYCPNCNAYIGSYIS